MRKALGTAVLGIVWLLGSTAVGICAEVSQGKCLKFEEIGKLIILEEYDRNFSSEHPYGRPTGAISLYDASGAIIGASPKPGDILRIAYEVRGTQRVALKVMNVTRQDLMKK